ncbi:transcription factor TFIIIC complex subunit Tfc6 [Rhodotorula toruloides]|uniref:Transcription factor TFIIIC complex subunit Tfc6 n=1 Tax=Rhodotorula toruloides TaxID=5286 RepID=A0A511KIX5_RHOTO|nr:transcription factor TFIIIC complex subunit Tfc6 [Rhodotorula toruloides]
MAPPVARPRRSTATTSFSHLLQPIDLDDSTSSSSGDEAQKDAVPAKKKDKGKNKAINIPEESSGSEFEADSGGGPAADEQSEDDYGSDEVVSEEDAGVSVSGASAAAGKKGIHYELPPRAHPPANHPSTSLGPQYSFFGPLATLQPYSRLKVDKSTRMSNSAVDVASGSLADGQIEANFDEWTGFPLGPDKSLVKDWSWQPGRWEGEVDWKREKAKWGGWYPEIVVRDEDIVAVHADQVHQYLPNQICSNRPSTTHEPTEPIKGTSTVPGTPAPDASPQAATAGLPVPPAEFLPPTAGPSGVQGFSQAEGATNGDGQLHIKMGGISSSKLTQEEVEVTLSRFHAVRLDSRIPRKPGHMLNAGGYVSSLAWLPRTEGPAGTEYLAVSTVSHSDAPVRHMTPSAIASLHASMIQIWSLPCSDTRDLSMETSEDADENKPGMRLEMALCLPAGAEGDAKQLAWCPRGGRSSADAGAADDGEDGLQPVKGKEGASVKGKAKGKGKARADDSAMDVDQEVVADASSEDSKLGILAGAFSDGSISIFAVPSPGQARDAAGSVGETIYVKAKPLHKLRLPETTVTSLAWGGSEVIAAGCINGNIAVWHVGDVLRSREQPETLLRPRQYLTAHTAPIRSLVFIDSPPPSLADRSKHDFDAPPTGIISAGYDGNAVFSDLRNPGGGGIVLSHERAPIYDVAYCAHTGLAYANDLDDRVRAFFLKPSVLGSEGRIAAHRGTVWSISASPHHPFILSTSADGSAVLSSGVRALRKRRVRGHLVQKLYRLEFNRATGDLRMWDNLQIEYRSALDTSNPTRSGRSKTIIEEATEDSPTAAWPLEQGIVSSAWHPSLTRGALCATGTAIGLVRIDWVEADKQMAQN